jgi:hypothetical protein
MRLQSLATCLSVFVMACEPQSAVTRDEALRLASKTMTNAVAMNAAQPNYELISENLDSTNGTRIFVFRIQGCDLHINVSAEGSADIAGMKGKCQERIK